MKRRIAVALLTLVAAWGVEPGEVAKRLRAMGSGHPRLFLGAGGEKSLVEKMGADEWRRGVRDGLLRRADRMLAERPVERVMTGRRLLHVSREALGRVLHLGLAWRLTGEKKYAERARAEMLAVARFADWNPSHFLDVAEMTAAMGIGYDWFYAALGEGEREAIRRAIVEKGLRPGFVVDHWAKAKHNWNQVCNGGLVIGALAVAEHEPGLAARVVARAVNTVPLAMGEYAPDGAYPEGASYWGYGTTYNVMLLAALESALGTDYGLKASPGFLATADYWLHVFGPTGLPFSYSDAGTRGAGLTAAQFWFAAARGDSYLLYGEWAKGAAGLDGDRVGPLLPVWLGAGLGAPARPKALSWTGRGETPVAFHRSGWDRDAAYVAVKGGSPGTNHAHMDAGSFVMDRDGVRWADDLGMQDYHSLESKGVALWSKGQEAERWKVFRLGTRAHGVPLVDGQDQRVEGRAEIAVGKAGRTVVDLDGIYRGLLAGAKRGVWLREDRTVLVQDEWRARAEKAAEVRWGMVTRAEVRVTGPGRAELTREGKRLELTVAEPAGAVVEVWGLDPPAAYDAPNPGARMVGFTVKVPAGQAARVRVLLGGKEAGKAVGLGAW